MMWFAKVKALSGLKSAYAIELALNPTIRATTVAGVLRPRTWDTYECGARVPSRAGDRSAIEQAERQFPGSAYVFDSPLWDLLKGRPAELTDASVFHEELNVGHFATTQGDSSNAQVDFESRLRARAMALPAFSSLEFLVLLATYANTARMPELADMAQFVYGEVNAGLFLDPEIAPFATQLRPAINSLLMPGRSSTKP